jgi:predicted nucleic acid-binding protein
LLRKYAERVAFFAPDTAFEEARVELPAILDRRGVPVAPAMAILDQHRELVESVDAERYRDFELPARQRSARRDEDDWPVLACALALDCPIWTEDTDFFGCGVATWTTDRVEWYLERAPERG